VEHLIEDTPQRGITGRPNCTGRSVSRLNQSCTANKLQQIILFLRNY